MLCLLIHVRFVRKADGIVGNGAQGSCIVPL